MGGTQLFVVGVAAYASLPLVLLALRRSGHTFALLYAHLGALLVLGGVLGAVYVLPLPGDVTLLAGQVSRAGFMFAALLTTITGRDVQVVRTILGLIVAVHLLTVLVSTLGAQALRSPSVLNPYDVAPAVFDHSLRGTLMGGVLLLVELLALIWLLEVAKRRVPRSAMLPVYPAAYAAILAADGVLLPLLALTPLPDLGAVVWAQVQAQGLLAAAFAVPLLGYVAIARRSVERFEASALDLRHLLSASPDELRARLDRQQQELDAQRARLLTADPTADQAAASVDRILDGATSTLIIALDTQLRVTHFNSGAEQLSGYLAEEVRGEVPPLFDDPEGVRLLLRSLGLGDGDLRDVLPAWAAAATRHDVDYRTREGATRTLSLTAHEIVVDGEPTGYLITGEDASARARSEQAMLRALQREQDADARLAEADRVKNELVSTVSHELRTPIASIQGYTEMLSTGEFGDLTTEQAAALDRVRRNTDRLRQLVEDLLLLEQAADAAMSLDRVRIDLREVVSTCADWTRDLLEGREITLGVSQPWGPVWVDGDQSALERLLANLTSNAAKFTTEGRIDLGLEAENGVARLWVRDTGIGISETDQEQLFTRFFRAGEAQALAIQGSGLGLSIVHGIAVGHGGTVTVDSAPGRGTTVTVTLPRV